MSGNNPSNNYATSHNFGYLQPTRPFANMSSQVGFHAYPMGDSGFLILVSQGLNADGQMTYYNVTPWYQAKSLRVTKTTGGERDVFALTLMDRPVYRPDGSVIYLTDAFPTTDANGQPAALERDVQIWGGVSRQGQADGTRTGGVLLCRGSIRRPTANAQSLLPNGEYALLWQVQGTGLERELDADIVEWTYQGTAANKINTTGWIARDIVTNQASGFVAALEDGTPTITTDPRACTFLPVYDTQHRKPTEILDELANIEGWSWSIVPYLLSDGHTVRNAIYFQPPESNPAPIPITDAVVEILTDKGFTFEPDSTNIVNYVELQYKTEYTDGMVKVGVGDQTVIGIGTKFLSHVYPGCKFQVIYPGITDTHEVERVLSDTTLILKTPWQQDAVVGPPQPGRPQYMGPTWLRPGDPYYVPGPNGEDPHRILIDGGANGSYRIFDIPAAQVSSDKRSMKRLAQLRGYGDGRCKQYIETNKNYTFDQARAYISAMLNNQSNPVVNVKIETNTWALWQAWRKAGNPDMSPFDIRAGMWFSFDVNKRFPIHETLQLKSVDFEDMGGFIDNKPLHPTDTPIQRDVWEANKDNPPNGFPLLKVTLSFETRLYSLGKLLRKYENAADRETVTASDPVSTALYESSGSLVGEQINFYEDAPPAVWGPIDQKTAFVDYTAIDSYSGWVIIDNQMISLKAGAKYGYFVSAPVPLHVPMSQVQPFTVPYNANGGRVEVAYRGVTRLTYPYDYTPWVADPREIPDSAGKWGVKAIQVGINLYRDTVGAQSPFVRQASYLDLRPVAAWGRTQWGAERSDPNYGRRFNKAAHWALGTFKGGLTVIGDKIQVDGSGSWTTPWILPGSIMGNLGVFAWITNSTNVEMSVRYRSSVDGTDANASDWTGTRADTPEANFLQAEITFARKDLRLDPPVASDIVVRPYLA